MCTSRCASIAKAGVTGVCNWGVMVSVLHHHQNIAIIIVVIIIIIVIIIVVIIITITSGMQENGVYWEECYCSNDSCNTSSPIAR